MFLTGLYVVVRAHTPLAVPGAWLDVVVILAAAQGAFWTSRRLGQLDPARRPAALLCLVWPCGALAVLPVMGAGGAALFALLLALHYAGMATVTSSRHLGVPAMICANAALFLGYAVPGWSDQLLYVVPVAVTLLGLVHIYAGDLGHRGSNALRAMILLALYTMSVARALSTLEVLHTLVLVPLLCVTGAILGTLLRIRVYVLMSIGFLALDLTVNMVHYGLARPHLGALFLTGLGLLLVAGMVVFSLERERILRRYSSILGELRTWE
jgi:hypothetical protein